jgi:hypothetical protein
MNVIASLVGRSNPQAGEEIASSLRFSQRHGVELTESDCLRYNVLPQTLRVFFAKRALDLQQLYA